MRSFGWVTVNNVNYHVVVSLPLMGFYLEVNR